MIEIEIMVCDGMINVPKKKRFNFQGAHCDGEIVSEDKGGLLKNSDAFAEYGTVDVGRIVAIEEDDVMLLSWVHCKSGTQRFFCKS